MKNKIYYLFFILGLCLSLSCSNGNVRQDGIQHITAKELQVMLSEGGKPVLLDVRTPDEFDGPLGHLDGALLIPLNELDKRISELKVYQDSLIVIYCRSGNRSQVAAKILTAQNYNVVNMVGGMKAWNKLN